MANRIVVVACFIGLGVFACAPLLSPIPKVRPFNVCTDTMFIIDSEHGLCFMEFRTVNYPSGFTLVPCEKIKDCVP